MRFATEEYKKVNHNNREDVFVHLTNFAINKNHPNFLKSECGADYQEDRKSHKRSILDFFQELRENGHKIDKAWNEVKKIIVKTLCSVQPILKHNYLTIQNDDPYNQGCFELLGFDILFDKNLKPYLLEVNHSPSFRTESQVDHKVKSKLIYDTLKMMKVNVRQKHKLMRMKRQQLNTRTLTGRRIKMNEGPTRNRCLEERDKFMIQNKGGFERIFPPEGEVKESWEPYDQFLEQAEKLYKQFTGAEILKMYKKPVISPVNILDISRTHKTLERIYGYKSKRYPSKKRKAKSPKMNNDKSEELTSTAEDESKSVTPPVKLDPVEGGLTDKELGEIKEENKSKEGNEETSKVGEMNLGGSQPLLKVDKIKNKSFNKTVPVNHHKAKEEESETEKKILERLDNLPQVNPRSSYNPGIEKKIKIKRLNQQASSNSLISMKRKRKQNLRMRSKMSYDQKVNKYLMSPYIDTDPFLSFNKNYKQKMKTLALKLHRSGNKKR